MLEYMSPLPTPRLILETLFPYLQTAAAYARQIQSQITALPEKEQTQNFFAAALTDADLSVQNLVEVALLGHFPTIRFYGEEHEQSRNTKYFRAIDLGEMGDYLVTLDPIDGTQFYLDGHRNYQIILTVLNADDYEAAIALSPSQNRVYYALRDEGAFAGALDAGLAACQPLTITPQRSAIYLGWNMGALIEPLRDRYEVVHIKTSYSKEVQISNFNSILNGELAGAVVESGKFIDGGAIAFLAQAAGCIVTTFDGQLLPPLHTSTDYARPGLVVAASAEVHTTLLNAIDSLNIRQR
jgi:fructose-1,6-bisphosphatase/inositol monophosphatase family enzyme